MSNRKEGNGKRGSANGAKRTGTAEKAVFGISKIN